MPNTLQTFGQILRRVVGWRCGFMAVICLLSFGTSAWSQETPRPMTDPNGEAKKPPAKGSELTAPDDTDVIRLLGEDGKVHTLKAGATLKRVLEEMERSSKPQVALPDSQITALLLEGKADIERERVELDATLEIQVRTGKPQARIPLRMNEATLLAHSYVGTGKLTFEVTDKTTGLVVWLNGEGKHLVKLKLAVPLKRTAATQRLQLSLPASVQSRLSLEVPQSRLTVNKTNDSTDVVTEVVDASRSRIVAHGFGSTLDLSWQGARDSQPTKRELQARTLILAEVLPDGVLLQAGQTIRATQGTFSAVTVRLPVGFKVDEVTDSAGAPLQVVTTTDGRASVTLSGETSGPVELIWQLTGGLSGGAKVDLTPLSVEEAVRQDGMLGVIAPEGYSLKAVDAESKQVDRIGAATFRRFVEQALKRSNAGVTQAFSFDGQFRAVFQLERDAARYQVSPRYELRFNGDSLELDATFQVQVFRGALDSLTLKWSNSRAEGWQMDVESNIFVLPEVGASGDDVSLRFGQPISRLSENTAIHVRARRPIEKVGVDFPISLPTVPATNRSLPTVVVRNAGNVESSITPQEGTLLRLTGNDVQSKKSDTFEVPENQRPRRYELPSENAAFIGKVTTLLQNVTCVPRTTLVVEVDRVRVTQIFDYNVQYERLSQVRLVVPTVLTERSGGLGAQFLFVKSTEDVLWNVEGTNSEHLTPTLVATAGTDGRQLRVPLPTPSWGRFRVAAQYTVPLATALQGTEAQNVEVPLLTAVDGAPKASQLQVRSPDNFTVRVETAAWRPEVALERFPTWGAEGSQSTVNLQLRVSPGQASEEFTVRRAAFRVRVDQGVTQTQAVYWIDGDVAYLSMELPQRVVRTGLRSWWDGHELARDQVQAGSELNQVRFDLSALKRAPWHVLAIEYATEDAPQFSLHNVLPAATPRFASDVWVAESLWELVLPFDQHLFVYPSGLTPRFRWLRNGLVWSRQGSASRQGFPSWVIDDESGHPENREGNLIPEVFSGQSPGNSYVFSSFGRQNRIEFQTMSQPSIVLSGAGLALMIAFVLVRIPATRHVLTLLLLGVAMALVGIWHFEPVQLLLQPALIGIGLAVVASLLESRIKRNQQLAFVTLSAPSELGMGGSSREQRLSPAASDAVMGTE